MKTRNSLVSNSSSASFIIAYDPTTKKKDSFTDDVVEVISGHEYIDLKNIDKFDKHFCLEKDEMDTLKTYLKDHPNYKLAYWSGDYSQMGRDEIIEEMFKDTKLIHTYCSGDEDCELQI